MSDSRPAVVCSHCRSLNSGDDQQCYRCGAPLPGRLTLSLRSLVQPLGREYPLTKILLAACILIYGLGVLKSGWEPGRGLVSLGNIRLSEAARWGAIVGGLGGEPWRLLSAVYVHLGVLHMVFNGLSLSYLGPRAERTFGSARFVVVFVLTGLCGFVVSDAYHHGMTSTAGASGAIFGLLGVEAGYLLGAKDARWRQIAGMAAVYALLSAMMFSANNAAHIGGFLSGVPMGLWLHREPKTWQVSAFYVWLAGALLALSVVAIALCHLSPVWQHLSLIEQARERYQSL